MGAIRIKRIYDAPSRDDGSRVLIDRIWPRGVSKKEAQLDLWLKDVAPSTELRKWFGHDPLRFEDFTKRYQAELAENSSSVNKLCELAHNGDVSLLYAAHDEDINHAVVLAEYLQQAGLRFDR